MQLPVNIRSDVHEAGERASERAVFARAHENITVCSVCNKPLSKVECNAVAVSVCLYKHLESASVAQENAAS